MKKIIFYLLLILCYSPVQAQTEIPLEIADGGYLFIKVNLNGTDTARFMLDTGGGINVISGALFTKLKGTMKLIGPHTGTRHNGESITGNLYLLPSLSVGSFSKTNIVVGEYAGLNGFDGLLSMDYFRDTPFTIDFINKKLIIETPRSLAGISAKAEKIPIRLKKNGKYELDFFVKICINDSLDAEAEFDTGAGFAMLMLHPDYLKKLGITISPKTTQGMGYYIYSTTLPKLSYCDVPSLIQLNHFVGFKEGLIYESLIGSGMFSRSKLTIDIPASKMYVVGN